MNRPNTFNRVKEVGIIPAVRASDPTVAVHAAKAIRAGGIPIVEISLAVPNALRALEAVVKSQAGQILVGAGSVLDSDAVQKASDAGAQFIVTPGFTAQAVEKALALRLAIFVGALTPSEVQMAASSGADAVKLFPCYAMGGARYFRALRGQYPHVDLIASGGVGPDTCSDYIRAGACAIGVGGEIADSESLSAGSYGTLTVRSKRLLEAVRAAYSRREGVA